jgi:hypothetical protein
MRQRIARITVRRLHMRTLIAIIAGCLGMLFTFSVLWSCFGVTQHSYGATDRFSQIVGTLAFLGMYQLPFSFVLALLIVWPTERLVRRCARLSRRHGLRAFAWLLVSSTAYTGLLYLWGAHAPWRDLGSLAIAFGIAAAGVATILFSRIIRTHDSATHPTA